MADNVVVSNSSAASNPDYRVWTDEVTVSAVAVQKQMVGIVDATADGTTRAAVGANGLAVASTVIAALPAGTNNIGDVDVLSVVPGTSATSLGKAEDAAHSSGDTGVMLLAVRNDAGTALAGASGDYIPLMTNASGALYVTGGGGGTQYVEDTASAGGETMTLAGVVRQDTLASSTSADGDFATLKVNANGELYVVTSGTLSFTGGLPDSTGVVSDAGTDRTVKYAVIDTATSGDTTLVAAVASRKIRVLSLFMVASAAVTVRFESGTGGTAKTGQMVLAANSGFVLPYNPHGWFETAVNTLLNLELSAAVSVDGSLSYAEVA